MIPCRPIVEPYLNNSLYSPLFLNANPLLHRAPCMDPKIGIESPHNKYTQIDTHNTTKLNWNPRNPTPSKPIWNNSMQIANCSLFELSWMKNINIQVRCFLKPPSMQQHAKVAKSIAMQTHIMPWCNNHLRNHKNLFYNHNYHLNESTMSKSLLHELIFYN